jgi:NADH-quinone oxidoreductase subunit F
MATKILQARLERYPDDSFTIERSLETGGYSALRKALTEMTPEQVHQEVTTSGLRGRGGADFLTGQKWAFLPPGAHPRYLVVNADEGEPATFKDRQLMERDPHQLIEGAAITSFAIGAEKVFIYCRGEMRLAYARLDQAIRQAYERGFLGQNVFGSGARIDIVLHRAAGAYICGEETALLSSLEGYRGEPRLRPPFPAVAGLYGRPTVVNNVETLSNLPWIVTHGGAAYAELGTDKSKGTRIFCLSGHVERPGAYEVELGISFRELIEELGGGVRGGGDVKFFIPGGASSPWYGPDRLDLPLDMEVVKSNGSMLGSGAIMVADQSTCPVRTTLNIARFFDHESCGQCTPCREGCDWMTKILKRVEDGAGRSVDIDLLLDVSDNIAPGWQWGQWPYNMTTICFLGPSASVAVGSAIAMFRDDFERHVGEKSCPFNKTPVGA